MRAPTTCTPSSLAARKPDSPPSAARTRRRLPLAPSPLEGEGRGEGSNTHGTLTVSHIGSTGDGVAALPDGSTAYLPFTLPGETVQPGPLTRRGDDWTAASAVLTSSPERQAAPCPYFGACGGCTLQHWQDGAYAAWKTAQVQAALARAGYPDAPLGPLARTAVADRRRVDLALLREGGAIRVGLHRHRSREVIDLHTCLVLEPELVRLIGALRQGLAGVSALRRTGSAVANRVATGTDLLLRTDGPLNAADRITLTQLAGQADICRIAWARGEGEPELACQLRPARIEFAGVAVAPPPGAFLQASRAGEAAIISAVLRGLPERLTGRARVVELFAGCGTLTLALAGRSRVSAYEGDAAAYAALRHAAGGRGIETCQRDLARQPVPANELAKAAAIVLDPPFAGAAAQMAAIARSAVNRVIYVSCNPAALARDARVLHGAGYRLQCATPIDQFLWAAAVESVVVFEIG